MTSKKLAKQAEFHEKWQHENSSVKIESLSRAESAQFSGFSKQIFFIMAMEPSAYTLSSPHTLLASPSASGRLFLKLFPWSQPDGEKIYGRPAHEKWEKPYGYTFRHYIRIAGSFKLPQERWHRHQIGVFELVRFHDCLHALCLLGRARRHLPIIINGATAEVEVSVIQNVGEHCVYLMNDRQLWFGLVFLAA